MTDRNAVAQLAYRTLRAAGLTHEAALAMLGNWDKESLLTPCRKQGDLSEAAVPSREYTAAVTSGAISREQFARDRIGYGLAQWTYFDFSTGRGRKLNLYDFWERSGKALDDPAMQTQFAVWELTHESEFASVMAELKSSDDLYHLTDLICKRYEKPGFNNVKDRYEAAKRIGALLASAEAQEQLEPEPPAGDKPDTPFWPPRVLAFGMVGADVTLLQALLLAHGYKCGGCTGIFNRETEAQVLVWQKDHKLKQDAIAGPITFRSLGLNI